MKFVHVKIFSVWGGDTDTEEYGGRKPYSHGIKLAYPK